MDSNHLINLSLVSLEKSRLRFIRFVSSSILDLVVGPSGLEPPTSCLSGTRSNLLSYEPMQISSLEFLTLRKADVNLLSLVNVSTELSSRTVSRKVLSPLQSLTSVFGMGTGGPSAFVALTILQ